MHPSAYCRTQLDIQLEHVVSPSSQQEVTNRGSREMHSRQSSRSDPSNITLDQGVDGRTSTLASEPTPAENLKCLIKECGVSPQLLSELLQELPPQRYSDVLLDYYFTSLWVEMSLDNLYSTQL